MALIWLSTKAWPPLMAPRALAGFSTLPIMIAAHHICRMRPLQGSSFCRQRSEPPPNLNTRSWALRALHRAVAAHQTCRKRSLRGSSFSRASG